MGKSELDYEQELAIDPHSLDEEWLRQSGLYMKYSEAAAEAERIRDLAKEKINVVRAELDKAIRKDPDKYGLEKVTDTPVAATILLQQEYKVASEALIQANYELNMFQSAVRAFDNKRSALENMVRLWLGSYFSGPKIPRDIPGGKRIIDMTRDKVSARTREALNRPPLVGESEEKTKEDQPSSRPLRRRG